MSTNSNHNPLISVIIPVYNVEQYLKDCINSVCNQTYTNLEIIVIDDGSTDNSGALCDEIAKTDSRIKVIHQENQGLSAARNTGLEVCIGEYISFIDSDDAIIPTMYETLLAPLVENNLGMIVCNFYKFSTAEELKDISSNPSPESDLTIFTAESFFEKLYENKADFYVPFIVAWNKLYSRELFADIRYPKGRVHEDNFVICPLVTSAKRIGFIDTPLYAYRVRENSIMTSTFSIKRLDKFDALAETLKYAKKSSYSTKVLEYIANDCIKTGMDYYLLARYGNKAQKEQLQKYYSAIKRTYLSEKCYAKKVPKLYILPFLYCPNLLYFLYSIYRRIRK